jgi:hypothetical protein
MIDKSPSGNANFFLLFICQFSFPSFLLCFIFLENKEYGIKLSIMYTHYRKKKDHFGGALNNFGGFGPAAENYMVFSAATNRPPKIIIFSAVICGPLKILCYFHRPTHNPRKPPKIGPSYQWRIHRVGPVGCGSPWDFRNYQS